MGVKLAKGGKAQLKKAGKNLTNITIGLGWDPNTYSGPDFDLDASVFLLSAINKVTNDNDLIFYNNKIDNSGAVIHTGDDRTGGNSDDGDDEQIKIDLTKLPANIHHIVFVVTIDEYESRHQNFGMVDNAYIHLIDDSDGAEEVRYDLTEEFSTETAVIAGSIDRTNDGWEFHAIGEGINGGLVDLCARYGVEVD